MRLILHAGTHKTGTTSIQHFAHDNHAALRERGLYFLKGQSQLGGKTKTWRSNNWLAHGLTGAYHERESQIEAALALARVEAEEGAAVLISSEDLSACCQGHSLWGGLDRPNYRALQRLYLARLAELLTGFDVEVVLVFRRADEYAESLYQTMVKSNRFLGEYESFLSYCAPLFDYQAQVNVFEEVFPVVRVLSYHELGPNLVESFMETIGFPATDKNNYRKNTSVDPRLIHWKALRDVACDSDTKKRSLHRKFIQSNTANYMFTKAGPASFWRGVHERARFHDAAVADFDALSFPAPNDRAATDARLSGEAFDAVTQCFETWQAEQGKGWLSKLFSKLR